jgi:hypothetical protein
MYILTLFEKVRLILQKQKKISRCKAFHVEIPLF